jgi:hypothetical protein
VFDGNYGVITPDYGQRMGRWLVKKT